ncbi:MAG: nuclear transport factor 2 family protein [Deltaproteobacteria bacterium]|nr:nuclear transport factor 2 family protein [Deltaproteobacteria bacterium]MBW2420294.1 nuclear transport factor 2 family protein [Deltaproteobacteria bacterium]
MNTEDEIRRLADLEAIRDLARRYAHCVWQRDAKGCIDLFTEDAVMDTGDRPPIVGRKHLLASYEAIFAQTELNPMVHNHVIELAGDRASGHCYLDLRAATPDAPMKGHGFYVDEYLRTPEGWKFASRCLTMADYSEADQGEAGSSAGE